MSASLIPSSTGLMNSFGIEPCVIFVLEDVTGARLAGIEMDLDVAVLAAAAGLLGVLHLAVGRAGQGFLVGDLRTADAGLDVELALQAVDDDLEVQLAHAGDDDFAGRPGRSSRGRSDPRPSACPGPARASPGRPWSSARSRAR